MRVHALSTGSVRIRPSQAIGRGHGVRRRLAPLLDAEWSDWLPIYVYAIEHRDGVILIDAGANVGVKSLPKWHPYFRTCVRFDIEREQEIGPQLRALGVGPSDVRTIVLTHLHIDHDGGLADFPKASVLVSPGELAGASGVTGRLRGYLPQRWPKDFDPQPLVFELKPFGPFAQSRWLTVDGVVVALPTPGHTPSHVSVALVEDDATLLFAGDASYNEANFQSRVIDGVAEDEAVTSATLDQLQALVAERPTVVLPTHDPLAAERLARRAVTGAFARAA
jgi:N-acyl homoserine lactone hydrolase